jgi:hypothetical protein
MYAMITPTYNKFKYSSLLETSRSSTTGVYDTPRWGRGWRRAHPYSIMGAGSPVGATTLHPAVTVEDTDVPLLVDEGGGVGRRGGVDHGSFG